MNFFNSNNISLTNQAPFSFNFFFGNIAFISLFISVLLYWFDFFDTRPFSKKLKNLSMIGANVSLAFVLMFRWYESSHFPLSNLYESLIGLSWGFTTVHLIIVLNPRKIFSEITKILNKRKLGTNQKTPVYFSQENQECVSTNNSTGELTLKAINSEKSGNYSSSAFSPEFSFSGAGPLSMPEVNKSFGSLRPVSNEENKITISLSTINDKIGAITAPTALLTSVFATFFLPPEITQATALIPALKSNWLTMHVTVMVASYAFLLIGSLFSITYCVYRFVSQFSNKKEQRHVDFKTSTVNFNDSFFNRKNSINYKKQETTMLLKENENVFSNFYEKKQNDTNNLKLATWLNTTSYRLLGLGFPLLTIGILSGAVWANEAWGSYWSWDPKETWALITWLVFAVYFHSRYTRSADSFVPATIASVGFVVIWICYLGVNLLGTGLHSYGWFSS